MDCLKLQKRAEFLSSSGSEFQTVGPGRRIVERLTAVRAESTARNSIRGWDEVVISQNVFCQSEFSTLLCCV